jgi:predicted lipoprotein with Yx(FWY)xxD motif
MNKYKLIGAASAAALLGGAGAALGQSAHASAAATIVTTKSSSLGTILATGSGKTLYADMNACTGGCLQIWPAYKAQGKLKAEGKAKAADLGKKNGQVTYDGHLLYTFTADAKGTSGEGSDGFYVVSPSGGLITKAARSTSSSSSGGGW